MSRRMYIEPPIDPEYKGPWRTCTCGCGESRPPVGEQADAVLAESVRVTELPGGSVVGGDAVEVGHDHVATVNATLVVLEDRAYVVCGLGRIVAMWQERVEPE